MHRLLTITALVALVLGVTTASALAHVTANPKEGAAGGFAKIDFRVPNEQDVPTTKLTVQIPEGVAFVSVEPVPGWEYETTSGKFDEAVEVHGEKVTEGVTEITWSGGEIKAGEFQEFAVSMRLPDEGEIDEWVFFPTLQEYEGGEVVKWIQKPSSADDDAELDKPAPSVTLEEGDAHGAAAVKEDDKDDDAKGDDAKDDDVLKAAVDEFDDTLDRTQTMAYIGVILGALSLLLWVLGSMRARRKD